MRSYVWFKPAGNCHSRNIPMVDIVSYFVKHCFHHFTPHMSNWRWFCFSCKIPFPLQYCSLPAMNTIFHHSGMIFCLVVYRKATLNGDAIPPVWLTLNGYERFIIYWKDGKCIINSQQIWTETKEHKRQPPLSYRWVLSGAGALCSAWRRMVTGSFPEHIMGIRTHRGPCWLSKSSPSSNTAAEQGC